MFDARKLKHGTGFFVFAMRVTKPMLGRLLYEHAPGLALGRGEPTAWTQMLVQSRSSCATSLATWYRMLAKIAKCIAEGVTHDLINEMYPEGLSLFIHTREFADTMFRSDIPSLARERDDLGQISREVAQYILESARSNDCRHLFLMMTQPEEFGGGIDADKELMKFMATLPLIIPSVYDDIFSATYTGQIESFTAKIERSETFAKLMLSTKFGRIMRFFEKTWHSYERNVMGFMRQKPNNPQHQVYGPFPLNTLWAHEPGMDYVMMVQMTPAGSHTTQIYPYTVGVVSLVSSKPIGAAHAGSVVPYDTTPDHDMRETTDIPVFYANIGVSDDLPFKGSKGMPLYTMEPTGVGSVKRATSSTKQLSEAIEFLVSAPTTMTLALSVIVKLGDLAKQVHNSPKGLLRAVFDDSSPLSLRMFTSTDKSNDYTEPALLLICKMLASMWHIRPEAIVALSRDTISNLLPILRSVDTTRILTAFAQQASVKVSHFNYGMEDKPAGIPFWHAGLLGGVYQLISLEMAYLRDASAAVEMTKRMNITAITRANPGEDMDRMVFRARKSDYRELYRVEQLLRKNKSAVVNFLAPESHMHLICVSDQQQADRLYKTMLRDPMDAVMEEGTTCQLFPPPTPDVVQGTDGRFFISCTTGRLKPDADRVRMGQQAIPQAEDEPAQSSMYVTMAPNHMYDAPRILPKDCLEQVRTGYVVSTLIHAPACNELACISNRRDVSLYTPNQVVPIGTDTRPVSVETTICPKGCYDLALTSLILCGVTTRTRRSRDAGGRRIAAERHEFQQNLQTDGLAVNTWYLLCARSVSTIRNPEVQTAPAELTERLWNTCSSMATDALLFEGNSDVLSPIAMIGPSLIDPNLSAKALFHAQLARTRAYAIERALSIRARPTGDLGGMLSLIESTGRFIGPYAASDSCPNSTIEAAFTNALGRGKAPVEGAPKLAHFSYLYDGEKVRGRPFTAGNSDRIAVIWMINSLLINVLWAAVTPIAGSEHLPSDRRVEISGAMRKQWANMEAAAAIARREPGCRILHVSASGDISEDTIPPKGYTSTVWEYLMKRATDLMPDKPAWAEGMASTAKRGDLLDSTGAHVMYPPFTWLPGCAMTNPPYCAQVEQSHPAWAMYSPQPAVYPGMKAQHGVIQLVVHGSMRSAYAREVASDLLRKLPAQFVQGLVTRVAQSVTAIRSAFGIAIASSAGEYRELNAPRPEYSILSTALGVPEYPRGSIGTTISIPNEMTIHPDHRLTTYAYHAGHVRMLSACASPRVCVCCGWEGVWRISQELEVSWESRATIPDQYVEWPKFTGGLMGNAALLQGHVAAHPEHGQAPHEGMAQLELQSTSMDHTRGNVDFLSYDDPG